MNSSAATTAAAGAIAPGTLLLEYRIRRVLGTGGFGITYEAQDPHLDKSVAIKEYLPSELAVRAGNNNVSMRSEQTRDAFTWGREQFLKEARVLARFNHPSLIHVYRFFEANNTAYFVMEYAEGATMDSILMRDGTITEAKIKAMLLPILDGLKDVHRARVLHRDIKPSNIIARKDGSAVLIDFGSARQNVVSMTRSIMSVVTTGYAPIEQYAVDGHQGPWTDIYALG
ncbi:MAG TPA: serine/threonine-protein kinase, partial [Solimonas sp.]|nr:serine/threonine-protein kinase [Solimonas sp.]